MKFLLKLSNDQIVIDAHSIDVNISGELIIYGMDSRNHKYIKRIYPKGFWKYIEEFEEGK